MPKSPRSLKKWLPAFLLMALILLMSATPGAQAGQSFNQVTGPIRDWLRQTGFLAFLTRPDWFKVGHVIAYGALGALLYRAHRRSGKSSIIPPLLIVLGFAFLDELLQFFTPGRSAAIADVVLDFTAALLAIVLMRFTAGNRHSKVPAA